tara:strand:+ start:2476 stop:2643 length:168 start_codon:yes stop_codon:yes gene_type:complete
MSRQLGLASVKMFIIHEKWLKDNGYKQQALSCRKQYEKILKSNQATNGTSEHKKQ